MIDDSVEHGEMDQEKGLLIVSARTRKEVWRDFRDDLWGQADKTWQGLGEENIILGGSLATAIEEKIVPSPHDELLGFAAVYEPLAREAKSQKIALPFVTRDIIVTLLADLRDEGRKSLLEGEGIIASDLYKELKEENPELEILVNKCRELAADKFSFDFGAGLTFRAITAAKEVSDLRGLMEE